MPGLKLYILQQSTWSLQGQTALHFAAHDGQVDFVKLLLSHGASKDVVDKEARQSTLSCTI